MGSPNIAFGASDDARLFHDGSNAFLYNDTGALILGGRSGNVGDVQLRTDGTVALRIDHSVNQCVVVGPNVASSGSKFEVQTTGQARALYVADADGTLHLPWDGTATSPNIGFGASEDGRLHHDGTNTELRTIDRATSSSEQWLKRGSASGRTRNPNGGFDGSDSASIDLSSDPTGTDSRRPLLQLCQEQASRLRRISMERSLLMNQPETIVPVLTSMRPRRPL